jgi:alpha-N-arabinofuranosidase
MNRLLSFLTVIWLPIVVEGQQATLKIGQPTGETVSRHIYGQFAEHLGRCIYDGFYRNGKIRMDIVSALQRIRVPQLRWPGGCFADQYHWRDGIGDKKKRQATVNTQWGMVIEDNSFGTHEFLQLCEMIGCEPYIGANVGTGSPQEMESWVEYLNFDGPSEMAKLRLANGHPAPYHVTFWGVGNESWGCGGRMTAEDYANKYREFAGYCKNYPNSPLKRIASGANSVDYHWTETLMHNVPLWLMQGVSLHYYTLVDGEDGKGWATGFTETQYFKGLKHALFMDSLIRNHSAIMDEYDPDKKVWLVVDEWGISLNEEPGTNPAFHYQQNSLRDALIAATTLNIFNNHCDRVKMANLAQTVNVLQALILTKDDSMLLTPTYHVFDLYKVHEDAKSLPIHLTLTPYYVNGADSISAINASASEDSNKVIHLSLVNLDPRHRVPVNIAMDSREFSAISGQILSSEQYTDINTFSMPDKVTIRPFSGYEKRDNELTVYMPPKAVVVLELHHRRSKAP